ncbi:MAG: DNA polymerase III subunit chi [Xylophilus ampelinus]
MTEIAFHFNVPDRLAHACRLVRKAMGQGARLVVAGPKEQLARVDQALWSFAPAEFLAHCDAGAPAAVIAASPVLLAEDLAAPLPHRELLINLGEAVPPGFGQFGRLIEIVPQSGDAERQSARLRWKHYSDRGYAIVRHDLAAAD